MEVYVPEETTGCRYHVWRLVTSPPFENFIMLLIVLNTLLLMMKVIQSFNFFVLFFTMKKSHFSSTMGRLWSTPTYCPTAISFSPFSSPLNAL